MTETPKQEDEDNLNPFKIILPFEKNQDIFKYLDPISIINFGKTSKFCDGLAENYDDRIVELAWHGLQNNSEHPRAFSFQVANSTDYYYSLWMTTIDESENREENILEIPDVFPNCSIPFDGRNRHLITNVSLYRITYPETREDLCWKQTIRGNHFDVSIRYFFEILKRNQNSIRNLLLKYDDLMNQFIVPNSTEYNLFFPRNLDKIDVNGKMPITDKFFSINDVTYLGLPIEFEELMQFRSTKLCSSDYSIDLEIYRKYLILWRDGKLHDNLEQVGMYGRTSQIRPFIFYSGFSARIGERENTPEGYSQQKFEIVKKDRNVNYRLIGIFMYDIETIGFVNVSKVIIEKKPND